MAKYFCLPFSYLNRLELCLHVLPPVGDLIGVGADEGAEDDLGDAATTVFELSRGPNSF